MDETPWTVVHSEYVRKDRWIGLRADDCLTPEGVRVAPYYVVEYPDWVQIVALDDEGCILLVRQYRHGAKSFTVELPAGRMEPGETDPTATARRELREETGYEAASVRLIASAPLNPASCDNTVHTVLCEGLGYVGGTSDDPTERIEVLRPPLDEALRRAQAGQILPMPQTASLLLALLATGRLARAQD